MDKNIKAGSSSGMNCPRCGGPVAVGTNPVLMQFGLIGMIIHMLTTSYSCPQCGPIKFREFPEEVRSRSRLNTLLGVLAFVALVAVVVVVVVWLNWS